MIEDFYQGFVNKVAAERNMSNDQVLEIAQGRVWNGLQAQGLGLVDTLGGLDAAIALAAGMAGIEEQENVRLVYYPKKRSLWGRLLRRLSVQTTLLQDPAGLVESHLGQIQNRPLTLLPFRLIFN
jgi:protease-4